MHFQNRVLDLAFTGCHAMRRRIACFGLNRRRNRSSGLEGPPALATIDTIANQRLGDFMRGAAVRTTINQRRHRHGS